MPRFAGHPVEPEKKPRFAGVAVNAEAAARGHANVPQFVPVGQDGQPMPGYNAETGDYRRPTNLDPAGAFALGAVDGVPVAGPGLSAVVKGAASILPAMTSGRPIGDIYDEMGNISDHVQNENPISNVAGRVTGAVAGTLPLMRAAPSLFGLGLGSKTASILASGTSGGVLNTADAGVRSGGDIDQMRAAGIVGTGLGMAGPVVGPVIGKAVKYAGDKLAMARIAKALGMDKKAAALMTTAAERDGLDPAAVQARLDELGQDGMLLDVGPNLKHMAGALATMPGEGKEIVRTAIGARDAGANRRIMGELDAQLGPAPIPSKINAGIEANQRALSPEYRTALQNAGPVDTLPIAKYLDDDIQSLRGEPQRVLQRVRSMLDHTPTPSEVAAAKANGQPPPGKSLVTDAGELLNARHAIDDMLETTQGSNAINALTTARQAVDDELRASVPGIKEVDAKYAELARQKEAVQRGQTVLASGREAPRPAELAAEFQQGALPQGMQIGPSAVPMRLRQGARAEIERIVGTKANDRVALKDLIKGDGDWNRDRLATLFDRERADKIIQLLERESKFADTSSLVTRNSESLARRTAIDDLTGQTGADFGVREGYMAGGAMGAARSAGVKGVERIVEALLGVSDTKAQRQIAETLTGRDSAVLKALLEGRSKISASKVDRVARALLMSSTLGR